MPSKIDFNISFEFFPPKTPHGIDNLIITAHQLKNTVPRFFSVTFGAGGSTREGTLHTVKTLKQQMNTSVAPHLACMGYTKEQLIEMILLYQSLGIKHIVALRGDLPSGMGKVGEFKFAAELVHLIREVTGDHFHIDVAAYPECHPQSPYHRTELTHFKAKMEAGANSAITQYFFNADAYFYFREQCEKHGIRQPITPGIMPITQFAKLVRFSDICGAEIPRWIRKQLECYGDDIESIKAFGFEVIYKLCEHLKKGGAPGLHFYTLNQTEPNLELVQMLQPTPLKTASVSVLQRENANSG